MLVKSKDPSEEALTKPTREFEPSKMLDMKDLLEDFHKIRLASKKENPTDWNRRS
jgi:hypothetical protein